MDECKHELPVGQCHLCKPPPAGVLKHGWRTRGGRAYHNDPDCDWLRKGHNRSRRQGKDVHDAVRVRWADVDPGELQPCEYCCTDDWLRRHGKTPVAAAAEAGGKPCLVREGDLWVPGTVVWEQAPRRDGLWWGDVRYGHNGREMSGVRSQRDLRPRQQG